MSVAGLILAGGASVRMGSPKALLDYRGETFLDRLIRIFGHSCGSVTVVLGHNPGVADSVKRRGEAHFVVNSDYALGQLSSLQCGLRAIPSDAEAVVFTPVDYPAIEETTVSKLISRFSQGGEEIAFVVPRFHGRRGHPVLFASPMKAAFLQLPPQAEARDVVRSNIERTIYVDVDDPGILRDVDDPQAYAELLNTGAAK